MKKLISLLLVLPVCVSMHASGLLPVEPDNSAVTPEMFGCVGDGVTDDTEALQKAFDYCIANDRQLVSHKGRTYSVTKTIVAHSEVHDLQVDFGGAVIMAAKPMDHILDFDNYDIKDRRGHSSIFNNLVLDCNSISGGICCPRACKTSFNFLMVRNCSLKAFRVITGYEVFVTNSHIHCTTGPESYGIYMDTGDCHFDNIVIINAHTGIFQLGSINFFDKIHSWLSHNVEGSVFVRVVDGLAHFEQSYCDTAEKGYCIDGPCVLRLIGCYYYNNPKCYDSPEPPVIFNYARPELARLATVSLEGTSFNTGGLDVRISNVEDNRIQISHCYFNPGISGNIGKFSIEPAPGITFRRAFCTIGDDTRFATPACEANNLVIDADLEAPAKGKVVIGTIPEAYRPSTDQYGIATLVAATGETATTAMLVAPEGTVSLTCPGKFKPVRVVVDMKYVMN